MTPIAIVRRSGPGGDTLAAEYGHWPMHRPPVMWSSEGALWTYTAMPYQCFVQLVSGEWS